MDLAKNNDNVILSLQPNVMSRIYSQEQITQLDLKLSKAPKNTRIQKKININLFLKNVLLFIGCNSGCNVTLMTMNWKTHDWLKQSVQPIKNFLKHLLLWFWFKILNSLARWWWKASDCHTFSIFALTRSAWRLSILSWSQGRVGVQLHMMSW